MAGSAFDVESLLQEAFSPVEPPARLEVRLEGDLGSLIDRAADELEAWELSVMRNPRNWVRPAGALLIGSAAAIGLVQAWCFELQRNCAHFYLFGDFPLGVLERIEE